MRRHERIPIHDHSDLDSGGFVAASTTVRVTGSETVTTSVAFGSPVAVGTALDDGALGVAARADHVHTNAYLGTVLVSGTAASGYALLATGAGTAAWQANSASVIWYDEGNLAGTAGVVNITGSGGTVTVSGGTATIDISGGTASGGGGTVVWYDEGTIAGTASIVNIVGSGGTVAVSGGTATVTISAGPAVAVRVRHNTTQSIGSGTLVALSFNTETFDTDAFHDTVTNNTRLTVPSGKAGKYRIYGSIEWASNTTGIRAAELRVNGTAYIAVDSRLANTGGNTTICGVTTSYSLAVSDYVELIGYQTSGGNLNSASSSDFSPVLGMELIGT